MDFVDIDKTLTNGENMGGLIQEVYFAWHVDVVTWPTKPDTPLDIGENGVLTGEITMETGKRFFQMYLTDDTGNLISNRWERKMENPLCFT